MAKESVAVAVDEPVEVEPMIRLRHGTKRATIYERLIAQPETNIPESILNPSMKGTKYAVEKLNEKLAKVGANWEIRRVKEENVVLYGLYEKGGA
jgi:hypothetical protein